MEYLKFVTGYTCITIQKLKIFLNYMTIFFRQYECYFSCRLLICSCLQR
jgi:hypothetical protein